MDLESIYERIVSEYNTMNNADIETEVRIALSKIENEIREEVEQKHKKNLYDKIVEINFIKKLMSENESPKEIVSSELETL
ncbi:MAG: hypothetical protein RR054_06175 [Clostridia bacterium]